MHEFNLRTQKKKTTNYITKQRKHIRYNTIQDEQTHFSMQKIGVLFASIYLRKT